MSYILSHIYKTLPDMPCNGFSHLAFCVHIALLGSLHTDKSGFCIRGSHRGWLLNSAKPCIPGRSHHRSIHHKHRCTKGGCRLWFWGVYRQKSELCHFQRSFADPRGLVGAVGCNDFVFGVMLTDIIIQRIKCYAVVNISGRNMYT